MIDELYNQFYIHWLVSPMRRNVHVFDWNGYQCSHFRRVDGTLFEVRDGDDLICSMIAAPSSHAKWVIEPSPEQLMKLMLVI